MLSHSIVAGIFKVNNSSAVSLTVDDSIPHLLAESHVHTLTLDGKA